MARGASKGSKELEKGLLAAEDLHRQVMPFILRRTKDQVLKDLPPKTISDRNCDLGALQQRLYQVFATGTESASIKEASGVPLSPKRDAQGLSGALCRP